MGVPGEHSLGNDNDAYLDVDSGGFYEKENGAWTLQFTAESVTVGSHERRVAISADTMLEQAEVDAGTTSTTNEVTTPMWGQGVLRYVFIGVPDGEDDITDILYNGLSQFSNYEVYDDAGGNQIVFDGHKWWRTTATQDGEFFSNAILEIRQ